MVEWSPKSDIGHGAKAAVLWCCTSLSFGLVWGLSPHNNSFVFFLFVQVASFPCSPLHSSLAAASVRWLHLLCVRVCSFPLPLRVYLTAFFSLSSFVPLQISNATALFVHSPDCSCHAHTTRLHSQRLTLAERRKSLACGQQPRLCMMARRMCSVRAAWKPVKSILAGACAPCHGLHGENERTRSEEGHWIKAEKGKKRVCESGRRRGRHGERAANARAAGNRQSLCRRGCALPRISIAATLPFSADGDFERSQPAPQQLALAKSPTVRQLRQLTVTVVRNSSASSPGSIHIPRVRLLTPLFTQ